MREKKAAYSRLLRFLIKDSAKARGDVQRLQYATIDGQLYHNMHHWFKNNYSMYRSVTGIIWKLYN